MNLYQIHQTDLVESTVANILIPENQTPLSRLFLRDPALTPPLPPLPHLTPCSLPHPPGLTCCLQSWKELTPAQLGHSGVWLGSVPTVRGLEVAKLGHSRAGGAVLGARGWGGETGGGETLKSMQLQFTPAEELVLHFF